MRPILTLGLLLLATALQPGLADPGTPINEESGVPPYQLPDPLTCEDGTQVRDAGTWRRKRRPELLRRFEEEIYGRTLVGRPPNLTFVRLEEKPALGGAATRLRIDVRFEGTTAGRRMELLAYLPAHARGPVPVFLGLNFDGNYTTTPDPDLPVPTHWVNGLYYNRVQNHRATESSRAINQHMWPYAYAIEHGYGVITAGYGQIEPDEPGRWQEGPRGLGAQPGESDWGTIGAWAWGLSRAMDYLETEPKVNPRKVAVFGFSRLGKAAVWAAAQDPRFALVISQASGAGGVALHKRLFGEDIAHLTQKLGHWFAPRFARYANKEPDLPIDQHQLVALIAPRPLLVLSGSTDLWSDPKGEFLGALGADPVYRLLGTDGLRVHEWPTPGTRVESTLGYYLRPGGHDVTLEDWQIMVRFADRHLRR